MIERTEIPLGKFCRGIRRNLAPCACTAVLCGFIFLLFAAFTDNEQTDGKRRLPEEGYRILPPALPDTLSFAGEAVPMNYFLVKERLERELMVNTYWQSNQLLLLKRSARYFPVLEKVLKECGIPDDFKFLALVESGLANVVSPAKAAGFWQLLPGTAKDLGLEVNDYVDERYNLEKATRAACAYLRMLYGHYGSWTLAAAAYNTGKNNIDYHLQTQQTESYYHLHLPEETTRYVYRILAEKLILNEPDRYGFLLEKEDFYQPLHTRSISVDTAIHDLFAFARQTGVSYQTLKLYNPWLRERQLPNRSRRKYVFLLPTDSIGCE